MLRRLFLTLLSVLILYVIYHDFTKGTLQIETNENNSVPVSTTSNIPFFVVEVKPGETVLTIVEKNLDKQIPVSITRVISDFEQLNDGEKPEKILIGKQYRFPDYSKSE
jgi:hypothetical protein